MVVEGKSGGIIGGLIFGALMFFGSFVLHWWNEGNAVKQFKTIGDLGKNIVEVSAEQVDPSLDGRAVYLSAEATTTEELHDKKFAISRVALRLRRTAEMYQWKESEESDSNNDTKSYSYSKVWSEERIDSSGFHQSGHANPGSMPYRSQDWTADDVSYGAAFKLPEFLVEDLGNFEPLEASAEMPEIDGLTRSDEGFYLGANPDSPVIGDTRISFAVVRPGPASLIAAQAGNSFTPWTSPKTGRSIYKIMPGTFTKKEVIARLRTEARLLLWGLRLGGFLLMFFGLMLLASPLTALANFVPVLGRVVSSGIAIIGLLVAGILSLLTIAVAWIAHRPMVGLLLLIVIGVLAFLLIRRMSQAGQRQTAGMAPPPPPPVPSS
jgi:hypothetical protein